MRPFRPLALVLVTVLLVTVLTSCVMPVEERPYQSFIDQSEASITSLMVEGREYSQSGRGIDAELKYRQALYLRPESLSVKRHLANALIQQGLTEEASSILAELLQYNPDSIATLSELAELYLIQGDTERAIATYRGIIERIEKSEDPKVLALASGIMRRLSLIHFRFGQEEEALCFSHTAKEAGAKGGVDSVRHVRLLLALGETPTAERELLVIPPAARDARFLHQMMLVSYQQNRFTEALQLSRRILRQPTSANEARLDAQYIEVLTLVNTFKSEQEEESSDVNEELRRNLATLTEEATPQNKPLQPSVIPTISPENLRSILDQLGQEEELEESQLEALERDDLNQSLRTLYLPSNVLEDSYKLSTVLKQ